jgi:hypothetical protein
MSYFAGNRKRKVVEADMRKKPKGKPGPKKKSKQTFGQRLIASAREARAIARGEAKAGTYKVHEFKDGKWRSS